MAEETLTSVPLPPEYRGPPLHSHLTPGSKFCPVWSPQLDIHASQADHVRRAGYAGTALGEEPAGPRHLASSGQGRSRSLGFLSWVGSVPPPPSAPLDLLAAPPSSPPFQAGPAGSSRSAAQAVGSLSHPFQNPLAGNREAHWEQELGGLEKTRSNLT